MLTLSKNKLSKPKHACHLFEAKEQSTRNKTRSLLQVLRNQMKRRTYKRSSRFMCWNVPVSMYRILFLYRYRLTTLKSPWNVSFFRPLIRLLLSSNDANSLWDVNIPEGMSRIWLKRKSLKNGKKNVQQAHDQIQPANQRFQRRRSDLLLVFLWSDFLWFKIFKNDLSCSWFQFLLFAAIINFQ